MSKALKASIEANDAEAVRKALKTVTDVNRKLPGANTPLLYACEKGADRVLEVLVQGGAIAEKRNTFPGDTPFAVAAKHGQGKVMERLLALGQASPAAIKHALEKAAIDGEEATLDLVLQTAKPRITIELFNLASVPKNGAAMLKLLVKRGADVNVRSEDPAQKGVTPLHRAASGGKAPLMRALVECGAEVNARDALGRTPLMLLAEELEWLEQNKSKAEALSALKSLLELGADASLVDTFGNDCITYCEFSYAANGSAVNKQWNKVLRDAGAPGSGPTGQLFEALRKKDVKAVRGAIKAGADVNRVSPPPSGGTPLMWTDSQEIIKILLAAGADPSKPGTNGTPLIYAARSGDLAIVKCLVAAGADIHAVHVSGEYIENAYEAAGMNRKFEVVDYLKSLRAGKPKAAKPKALEPGVGSWNDFSELLVKCSVECAAGALARLIKGSVKTGVYGKSMRPGNRAYVVARPKGMDWCNVFQIAPPRLRYEDSKKSEAFADEFAKAAGAPVLSIEYSDTSDAASIVRVEPNGRKSRDQGWDRGSLEEMVGALGDQAPAWAKKQLARTDEDAPSSTERVVMLAEQEKFVVAAFGLDWEPGRPLEIEFSGYDAEAFEGVAFVGATE